MNKLIWTLRKYIKEKEGLEISCFGNYVFQKSRGGLCEEYIKDKDTLCKMCREVSKFKAK